MNFILGDGEEDTLQTPVPKHSKCHILKTFVQYVYPLHLRFGAILYGTEYVLESSSIEAIWANSILWPSPVRVHVLH